MSEEAPYTVIRQAGQVEIRNYPAMRVASVSGYKDNEAFGHLFSYITGNNRASEKIAMTAPVISDAAAMSFVMPGGYTLDDLPQPLDARVHLQEIPSRTVAVIRFRGRAGPEQVTEVTDRLIGVLSALHITVTGSPFLMRYNPPFVPGFLRRNEVGVAVDNDQP